MRKVMISAVMFTAASGVMSVLGHITRGRLTEFDMAFQF